MVKRQLEVLYQFAPGLLAALFYGVVSGSMSFLNKVLTVLFLLVEHYVHNAHYASTVLWS